MSIWIKSYAALADHPKVRQLRGLYQRNLSQDEAIGLLHRFWWAVAKYCPSGIFTGWTKERIGLLVKRDRISATVFCDRLIECGLLDSEPLRVHDWLDYSREYLYAKYRRQEEVFSEIERQWSQIGPAMPPVEKMPDAREPKVLTLEAEPARKPKAKRKTTKQQALVEHFAKVKGLNLETPAQVNTFFKCQVRALTELLAFFGEDLEAAKEAIDRLTSHYDQLVANGKIEGWSNASVFLKHLPEVKLAMEKDGWGAKPQQEISDEPFIAAQEE